LRLVDKICLKFDRQLLDPMRAMVWMVSIFWAWYLVDMIGDERGWTQAKWILPLMLGLPVMVSINKIYKLWRQQQEEWKKEKSGDDVIGGSESSVSREERLTEMITLSSSENPLQADA
jgi:hypothetical protein